MTRLPYSGGAAVTIQSTVTTRAPVSELGSIICMSCL